jgi:EpsI family protein
MRRQAVHALVALALVGVAGALVAAPASLQDVPLRMDFEAVPDAVAGFRATAWSSVAALPPDPRAPRRLTRAFEREGRPVWTMVEYYPSQESERRAAARDLVFPSHGWSQIAERRVDLPAPAAPGGRLEANLVVLEGRPDRVAIVYWYQIGQQPLASDHWYRVELLYNGIAHGRTDGALVRIATPLRSDEAPEAALPRLTDFLREFYPLLLRSLPR